MKTLSANPCTSQSRHTRANAGKQSTGVPLKHRLTSKPPFLGWLLSFFLLSLGTAPGSSCSRASATRYTRPVLGSLALTYTKSGCTHSARLLGRVLQCNAPCCQCHKITLAYRLGEAVTECTDTVSGVELMLTLLLANACIATHDTKCVSAWFAAWTA